MFLKRAALALDAAALALDMGEGRTDFVLRMLEIVMQMMEGFGADAASDPLVQDLVARFSA